MKPNALAILGYVYFVLQVSFATSFTFSATSLTQHLHVNQPSLQGNRRTAFMKRHDYEQSINLVDVKNNHQEWRRRNLISFILTSTSGVLQLSQKASAATASPSTVTATTPPAMTQTQIQNFLNSIPTFCIVDTKGVPFTVVGEDAKLTSYFFITFEEADR